MRYPSGEAHEAHHRREMISRWFNGDAVFTKLLLGFGLAALLLGLIAYQGGRETAGGILGATAAIALALAFGSWIHSILAHGIARSMQAEQSLRVSEERFRNAFDHAPIGMALVSPDGHWLQTNEALCQITGYSSAELLGMTFQDITHPDDLNADLGLVQKMLAEEIAFYRMEKRYIRKDGQIVWVLLSVARSHNDIGKAFTFVSQVEDISDRKRAHELLDERARLGALTAEVGIALTQEGRLQVLLQRCTEALVRHLGAAFARIWTLDPQGDVLILQASAGLYTHIDGAHARIPLGMFKIGQIAQERKPHLTNQVIGDSRVRDQEWARREGMIAFAGQA